MIYNIELKCEETYELVTYPLEDEEYESFKDLNDDKLDEEAQKLIEDFDDCGFIAELGNPYGADEGYFSLVVTDEDGNEVWSTDDIESIRTYSVHEGKVVDIRNEDSEKQEIELSHYHFETPKDGYYLVKQSSFENAIFRGEIEVDEFDPSKFSFYPAWDFDDCFCDDPILNHLNYDGEDVGLELDYSLIYHPCWFLNKVSDGKWVENWGGWV